MVPDDPYHFRLALPDLAFGCARSTHGMTVRGNLGNPYAAARPATCTVGAMQGLGIDVLGISLSHVSGLSWA